MNVLVDTSVWSLAMRRRRSELSPAERQIVFEWRELVREGAAQSIGAIRQEVLSGIRSEADFERLRDHLADFEDLRVDSVDHVEAARFYNVCQARGLGGTHVDLLICAVAHRYGCPVFTTDKDFHRYAKHLPLRLHSPRAGSK